jgi:hypothetical protein
MPAIEAYKDTQYHLEYFKQLKELINTYPADKVKIIRFPSPYYPEDLFAEHVHYECEGAGRLNADFYSGVMPEILRFAPPDPDLSRNRKL